VYDLIGNDAFSVASIDRIRSVEPSISGFEIFLGLSTDLRKKYPDDYEIFINPDYDIESQYKASVENKADKTSFTIAIYSNLDDTVAPEGKSVVTINMLSGYNYWNGGSRGEYQDKKEKVAETIIKRASKIIPEISSSIEKKIVSTPITFKRYTNNSRGAIYGCVRTADCMEPRLNDIKEIKNLYFASAWARQGSGVEKVVRSAEEAARRILRKELCQKVSV
jgi:phytoene dehydrogenase-like protein